MLRFLHCADLHLDRAFEGLHTISDQVAKLLENNEQVLENIVSLAITEKVEFILFSGDTFHQNRPTFKTQYHFVTQMERLKEANILVYMIFGNHDYYEKERYWFEFPENVHLFTEETVKTYRIKSREGKIVAISGFSYQKPHLSIDKALEFPMKQADIHIGLYHGDPGSTMFAPFQVQELKQKGYDYWALGHIHVPTVLAEQPPVLYPGTPQGHTQKEERTGVVLVEIDSGKIHWQARQVAAVTWCQKQVDLSGVTNQKEVLQKVEKMFDRSRQELIKIIFYGRDHLPKNWLSEKEKAELIAYLNASFADKHWQQMIYELSTQEVESPHKMILAADPSFKEQLLRTYQENPIFAEMVAELYQNPLFPSELRKNLKRDTFIEVEQELIHSFSWRDQDEAD